MFENRDHFCRDLVLEIYYCYCIAFFHVSGTYFIFGWALTISASLINHSAFYTDSRNVNLFHMSML